MKIASIGLLKRKTQIGFALAALAVVLLPAYAEGQYAGKAEPEEKIVRGIVALMPDRETTAMRGGDSEHKGLGFYAASPNVDFKSGYALIPAKTMAQWAYDLHQFVLSKGGSYADLKKFTVEHPADPKKYVDPFLPDQKPNPNNPYERSHVSYDEQKKFAEKSWATNADYRDTLLSKDWWLNDAILDGNNLWYRYEAKHTLLSSGYINWRDIQLEKLAKKN